MQLVLLVHHRDPHELIVGFEGLSYGLQFLVSLLLAVAIFGKKMVPLVVGHHLHWMELFN